MEHEHTFVWQSAGNINSCVRDNNNMPLFIRMLCCSWWRCLPLDWDFALQAYVTLGNISIISHCRLRQQALSSVYVPEFHIVERSH